MDEINWDEYMRELDINVKTGKEEIDAKIKGFW